MNHDGSAAVSRSRREFLREATGACLASTLLSSRLRAQPIARARKAVVVTFGGGARDDETFMPEGRQNIPHLVGELLPRGAFFTRVVNRGILGHYVANASLATGAYETINNFVAAPPEHPTVFEYFRKELKRPASDVWVIAPSLGFERIGESRHAASGRHVLDPEGALVDADMGAYYTWLNQMRLTGAERSACLVWFEDHGEAFVVAPSVRAGAESTQAVDLNQLLDMVG